MSRIRLSLMVWLAVLAFVGPVEAQVPSRIPVALPVNGHFFMGIDHRLLMFDASSGEVQILVEQQSPRPVDSARLSRNGTDIVYVDPLNVQVWGDFRDFNSAPITFFYDPQKGIFEPQGWSSDGKQILGIALAEEGRGREIQVLNVADGSHTTLRRYENDELLEEDPTLEFFDVNNASWNPVHSEWIAMNLITFPVGSEDIPSDARFAVSVALAFNYVTGETLMINDFLSGNVFVPALPVWSADGRFLFIETVDAGLNWLHILEFRHTGSSWTFDVVKSGVMERGTSIDYWLGVQDMVIERSMNSSTGNLTYYIGQIINGELQRTEFFRIPLTEFSRNIFGNIYLGDWRLEASEEEKRELSCLFDSAQPSRFNIGDRAQISFATGTPLRTAPDLESPQIMQMAEGTEFEVIAGPACVNASDYYRFWQIELADGTIGWAAEAGMADYFMAPVPTPTVTLHEPVTGLYATGSGIAPNTRLGIFNASNNTWMDALPLRSDRVFWDGLGQQIALRQPDDAGAILNYPQMSVSSILSLTGETFDVSLQEITFTPLGWSNTNNDILYYVSYRPPDQPREYRLYLIDPTGNVLQLIRVWNANQAVADLPFPPDALSVQISGTSRVERNPVYDNWLVIQLAGNGFYSNVQTDEAIAADINVLWNFRTHQAISLDALVPDLYISSVRTDWSRDGTRLLLNAVSKDLLEKHILAFHFTPQTGAILMSKAVVENRTAEHWLDAGDMFFSRVQDYQNGAAYVLGEIVEEEYRETPFFTLDGDIFQAESRGDWFMQADQTERNALSCLFDDALAVRLEIGTKSQIVMNEGAGLHLHTAPGWFSEQIYLMDEGTTMSVMDGPACSGGYRWWQIQLVDGTTGWTAEANRHEYFLQLPDGNPAMLP